MTRVDYYVAALFVFLNGARMALDGDAAIDAGNLGWGAALIIAAICTTPLIIKLVREP